ncbi:hypothetical protein BH10PSE17_BH10PSE17_09580 [soil metagenome]
MKSIVRLSLLAAVLALAACTPTPVPDDKLSYVGDWQSETTTLSITKEGRVSYKRQEGSTSSSVNAPIKAFNGNDFEVGMGPISTTFVVSQPPTEQDGAWVMVVDGKMLRKKSS